MQQNEDFHDGWHCPIVVFLAWGVGNPWGLSGERNLQRGVEGKLWDVGGAEVACVEYIGTRGSLRVCILCVIPPAWTS